MCGCQGLQRGLVMKPAVQCLAVVGSPESSQEVNVHRATNTHTRTQTHIRVQVSLVVAEECQWVVSASLLWLTCITVLQHVTGGGRVSGLSLSFLTIAWEPASYLQITSF